jgi:predicted aspartyl protease
VRCGGELDWVAVLPYTAAAVSGRAFLNAAIVALTALATTVLAVDSSTAESSKPKVYPVVKEGLPSTALGCDAGTTENGVTTIPIRVNKVRDLVEPVVNMCFEGKGPYPMLIDTGAEFSFMSTGLAKELGLDSVGSPRPVRGAGCMTTAQNYRLREWSLGGLELTGGEISTIAEADRDDGHVRGSLGADVLSRFGAARIDFKNETLVLSGEEQATLAGSSKSEPIPSGLVKGKPRLNVQMVVSSGPGGASQTVKMGVGSERAEPWLIDTGANYTFVDPRLVRKAGWTATGTAQKGDTVCSIITVPEYTATSLTLGGHRLKSQTIASFAGNGRGPGGTVGAFTLWQYGSVVFDWAGGRLLLGAG